MIYPTDAELRERVRGGRDTPAQRFERAHVADANGCWHWTKGRTTSGYGHFSIRSIYYQAHRIAYILHRGTVPVALQLDHLCRNRWCVNPWHLEIVTSQENTRRGAGARLNHDLVARIRTAVRGGLSQRAAAPLFGVDHSTVSRIMSGQRWADLGQEVAA